MPANISPLAQTFKVDESYPQGMFVTSIDLFFSYKSPTETESVEVQIVETLNGYPTDNVVEFAKVVKKASSIVYSSSTLVASNFKFPVPIYLEPKTEYAIKIISNSQKYKVWTSVMGQPRMDNPAILIVKQPALGSFFKSQNNSTWTPEQLQDLTFKLYRAKFNKNVIGKVNLVEASKNNIDELPPNPFKITNGYKKVKVHHINHGLAPGMFVQYSGSSVPEFNNKFEVVTVVNSDYYIINTVANQTDTNNVGGGSVIAEGTIKFDTIRVLGISEGRDVGIKMRTRLSSASAVDSADIDIVAGEYIDLTENKYVHSSINRSKKLAGASSFILKNELSTINDAVSPIIDLDALSVQLISNKINRPSVADIDFDIDGVQVVTGASNVSFNATTNKITIPSTTDYTQIKEGAYIKVVDVGGANDAKKGYISDIDTEANTLTIVGDTLVNASGRSANIIQYTSFISETANGGTAEAKHITKQVSLTKMCTGFRVILLANIHNSADIDLYYRTGLKSDLIKLSDTPWSKHLITYKKTASETEFVEYEYNITGLEKFDEFQFKFVFLSSNTAVTPKIKKLRIIAHA